MNLPVLEIGNKQFNSRLILGTGKYPSLDTALQSIEYSQTEMVTVAIRRLQKRYSLNPREKFNSIARLGQIMVVT